MDKTSLAVRQSGIPFLILAACLIVALWPKPERPSFPPTYRPAAEPQQTMRALQGEYHP
jgi:hypothetical protein